MDNEDKIISRYSEFKKIPFPNNSKDHEEMQDAFTDIVLFDSYIAGTIEKLIQNKAVLADDLVYDQNLESRILEITGADPDLKKSYLDYLAQIKELIRDAQSLVR